MTPTLSKNELPVQQQTQQLQQQQQLAKPRQIQNMPKPTMELLIKEDISKLRDSVKGLTNAPVPSKKQAPKKQLQITFDNSTYNQSKYIDTDGTEVYKTNAVEAFKPYGNKLMNFTSAFSVF